MTKHLKQLSLNFNYGKNTEILKITSHSITIVLLIKENRKLLLQLLQVFINNEENLNKLIAGPFDVDKLKLHHQLVKFRLKIIKIKVPF